MSAEQPKSQKWSRREVLALPFAFALGSKLLYPKQALASAPVQTTEFTGFQTPGLNIDPQKLDCNIDLLKALGTSWVRFTLKRQHDYSIYLNQLTEAGIDAVCVVEKETIKLSRWDDAALFEPEYVHSVANHYAQKYPQINFLQIGNEMDDDVGFSSWKTEPDDYNRLLLAFNQAFVDKFLIAGGLSTGNADILDQINLSLVKAIAVHPYGVSTPDFKSRTDFTDAETAFTRYKEKTNLPVLISEAGVNHSQYSPENAARYVRSLMEFYKEADVLGAAYFCLSDLMVENHGLFNKQGQPKPSLEAFLKSIHGDSFNLKDQLQLNTK